MEILNYGPWQVKAAWGGVFLVGGSAFFLQGVVFLSLPLVALAAFYLYAAVGPLLRASLQVALEPEGMRMGGFGPLGLAERPPTSP
ncbi:hypothetical protein [Thermus caldifontis]|uniref:hypothetical protein n=1 Tax=Thermus caldifontis TaxID=1930763 RepID=UPI000DF146A2|nr:hypothetical protein [Thermus caldifontis]